MKFKSYSFGGSSIVYKLLVIIGFALSLSACQWGDEIESLAQPNPDDFAVLLSAFDEHRVVRLKVRSWLVDVSLQLPDAMIPLTDVRR